VPQQSLRTAPRSLTKCDPRVLRADVAGWQPRRTRPPELLAEAAAHPGGSVYEIDGSQVPDPNGYVPPVAIIGEFPVDENGQPTGIFLRNPKYGPIQDDFTRLTDPDHWLGWLPDEPSVSIRNALLEHLTDRVPGSTLEWVKITEKPVFRTAVVGNPNDATDPDGMKRTTLTRAGLAVALVLSVVTTPPTEVGHPQQMVLAIRNSRVFWANGLTAKFLRAGLVPL
jgi:hypothetical protein